MHINVARVEAKIERFVRERLQSALYIAAEPVNISVWDTPGEPVPFATARTADFTPSAVGTEWGAPWSTRWFHVTGTVPQDWSSPNTRPELVIDLGFTGAGAGFQAEGLVYTRDGDIVKGIEPLNNYVPVGAGGSGVDLFVEAAANPIIAVDYRFDPTPLGDKLTAGDAPLYRLRAFELRLLSVPVWELVQDVKVLVGLLGQTSQALPRRMEILLALDRMVDHMDPDDIVGTVERGRDELRRALSQPAHASAHNIAAVGHAHIDSAWLWPVRETVRKVARTFSNVLSLMDEYDDFIFTASSAQQFAWLKRHYPVLFERVARRVAEGRFIPAGGMWVESDTNMPGGESLVRQFVAGKSFFLEEFGYEPLEVWLPDSFGYSAALPQIAAAAGSKWFLTQKISWNETNRMPHHTFLWEGIDGTRIFTHFPPVDTYNSDLSVGELIRAESQFSEKGAANSSLVPFGWGDGGGGPTREMLAAALRSEDLEGSPKVKLVAPARFFEEAQAELAEPAVWSGELYLELHRGTYTSQAKTKRGNRRSEHLLREAELWATAANILEGTDYPYASLREAWETVLLHQFHDILPGSSIAWVHQEAERAYAAVASQLECVIQESMTQLVGNGTQVIRLNAGPYEVDGVPGLGGSTRRVESHQIARETESGFILENDSIRLSVDRDGQFASIYDKHAAREVVPAGANGNLFTLFRDTPVEWDAWDIDDDYRRSVVSSTVVTSILLEANSVHIVRSAGSSTIRQQIYLGSSSGTVEMDIKVDWHEHEKLLKLHFPVDVQADRAASEIQFGHIYRPTHVNTSWDAARFETVAHRWVHVGDASYGVAVANDAVYGHDVRRRVFNDGRPATVVGLSLLRAPLYPDPTTDQGEQEFHVALRVGAGIPDAIEEGYRANLPIREITGGRVPRAFLAVDNNAIVVEAVKLAQDGSGDVIVRLYEAHGARSRGAVTTAFEWNSVAEVDLLERVIPRRAVQRTSSLVVGLDLRPFQLATLRFKPLLTASLLNQVD